MKILIVGASGYIGLHLFHEIVKVSQKNQIFGTGCCNYSENSFLFLDVSNKDSIKQTLHFVQPELIVYLASIKNVNYCETHEDECYSINVNGFKSFIESVKEIRSNTRIVYVSSDYVFDGEQGMYLDGAIPKPNSIYGISKLLAENVLLDSGLVSSIVRTSAVISSDTPYSSWLINEYSSNHIIDAPIDSYITPTPLTLLTDLLIKMIFNYHFCTMNIIHISGGIRISRYDYAILISNLLKIKNHCINPTKYSHSLFPLLKDSSLVPSTCVFPYLPTSLNKALKPLF